MANILPLSPDAAAAKYQCPVFDDVLLLNMVEDLEETARSLDIYARLLREAAAAAGIPAPAAQAFNGLLGPLRFNMERQARELRHVLSQLRA